MTQPDLQRAPAPWDLRARAYVLVYKFPRYFVNSRAFLDDARLETFAGGYGSLMIVRYSASGVGAYDELLFVPGQFWHNGAKWFSVSRIFVSTLASVVNGQANWGLDKASADFTFVQQTRSIETVQVCLNDQPFFEATLWGGYLPFPVTTALSPFPFGLVQKREGRTYLTKPTMFGWGQLAKLLHIRVNGDIFPDVSDLKPIAAVKLSGVRMHFPSAQIE